MQAALTGLGLAQRMSVCQLHVEHGHSSQHHGEAVMLTIPGSS